MSVYYISTGGSDSNPGTIGSPFLTIARGIAALGAGDTLFIRAGTYAEPLRWPAGGSSGAPTIVSAYAGETVIIQPTSGDGIAGAGAQAYTNFIDLILDGTDADDSSGGFHVDADHVTLDGCEIRNWSGGGVHVSANFATIRNCLIHDNGASVLIGPGHGIYLVGQNALIEHNAIYDNDHYAVHVFDSGANHGLVNDNVVRFNIVHGNGKSAVGLTPGGFGILLSSGERNQAIGNVLWDNGDTGLTSGGIQVKDCSHAKVLANTLYGHPIYSVLVQADAADTIVRNNLIRNEGTGGAIDDSGSGTVADHNWTDADADPLFVDAPSNDFRIDTGSPCIGAGADLSAEGVTLDIINTPRPIDSTFDIGAYEYFLLSVSPGRGAGYAEFGIAAEGFSPAPARGAGAAEFCVEAKAFSRVVVHRAAENPKTYTLRIVEKRDGANGISEIDFVREDLSIYDSVAQYPVIGANVAGGGPAPPTDPNADDHSDASVPGSTRLVLLDIPQLLADHTTPGFYAAASGLSSGWHGALLYEKQGQDYVEVAQLGDRAKIGKANTKLDSGDVTLFDAGGRTYQFDDVNTVDIELIESVSALASVSDADLEAGNNIAAIGQPGRWEIVGFGTVTQLSERKWRLSHLLRGLKGTEWAVGLHKSGDQFVALDAALRRIKDEFSDLNIERKFRAVSVGNTFESANDTRFTDTGVSLKPLAPVYIRGEADADDNRVIRFYDRSRYDGLAGRDGTESPPGDENPLRWEMDVYDGASVVRTLSASSEFFLYTAAQQTTDFGSVPSSLTVKIYKISPIMGRGYAGEATISVFDSASITPSDSSAIYDIYCYVKGTQVSGRRILVAPLARDILIPAGIPIGWAKARKDDGTAATATADTVYSLQKNGVEFGTLTFSAGQSVGVLTSADDTLITANVDDFDIVEPIITDLTLQNVGISIGAIRI